MKIFKMILLSFVVTGLIFVIACERGGKPAGEMAGTEETMAEVRVVDVLIGDVAEGKALFNDSAFGGSTNDKSCNMCHPNGRGLEGSGDKKEFNIMGMRQNSLEEAVNVCIENPLQGKAIDPESQEMVDIVTYIKSLKIAKND